MIILMPIAMEEKLRFAIREGGRTVGSGVVAKITEWLTLELWAGRGRPAGFRQE